MDYISKKDPAVVAEQARVLRLKILADKVINARITLTKTMMAIGDFVEEMRVDIPSKQLKSFIHNDCKVPRTEAGTFMKLASKLGSNRQTINSCGLGFPALKALVGADEDVRNEILTTISAGTTIDGADVRAARRRQMLEREDASVAADRQRKLVMAQLAKVRSKAAVGAFEVDIASLARQMEIYFHDESSDRKMLDAQRLDLQETARTCLEQFEAIHDTDGLLPEWELGLHKESEGSVRLTRAHLALKAFADGRLKEYDDETGNPFDTDNAIDLAYYNALAWLSGNAVEPVVQYGPVVYATPRPALHTVAPHPLVSLEICAGAGGEALGLHAAGFHAKAIYERNPSAVATLRQHPFSLRDRVHQADIREVDFRVYRGQIDLVAGGVPCQGHSTSGKRKGKNDERDLFLEAVRLVDEVRPRAFLFENVEGFSFRTNINYRAELHQKFQALGYESRVFMLHGSDYGLAQHRPRVAFVGFRDGEISRFRMPPKFPQWKPTVASSIGDLVAANGWQGFEAWATGAQRIGPTIVGGSEDSGRLAFSDKRQGKIWGEMGIDFSYLANEAPAADKDGLFRLTLKMGQRLQGFPDDWNFQGRNIQKKCQIGNAFPPVMAKAVGLAIYSALEGIDFDYEAALKLPFETPTAEKLRQKTDMRNLNQPTLAERLRDEMRFFGEPLDDDNEM